MDVCQLYLEVKVIIFCNNFLILTSSCLSPLVSDVSKVNTQGPIFATFSSTTLLTLKQLYSKQPLFHRFLCEHFAKYFCDKIRTIRANFSNQVGDVPSVQKPKIRNKLFNLEPASEDEVRKIIMKSAAKSCDLDPIPMNILKALLDILIKPITTIINLSLESGTFPLSFKEAHVTPLLNKSNLPVKGVVNCQNSRDKGPPEGNSARG